MSAVDAVEAAIEELARLDKVIKKGRPRPQVTLSDERSLAKATALAWFNSHRTQIAGAIIEDAIAAADESYRRLLESSDRAGARKKYISTIKRLRDELIQARSDCVATPAVAMTTADVPPDFKPLVSDPAMQAILIERWIECTKCLGATAALAATVMMGGLLETLLLARVNRESDKKPVFTAKAAPKDHSGASRPLGEWMLKDFIGVAHERGWMSVSAKDVGAVLRDYRNYVHPHKQLSHGVQLKADDAALLWEISKSIARQVIASAK